jgi:hypothetical protein
MMFSKEDFKVNDPADIIEIAPMFILLALVAPFLMAAYALGFVMDLVGWLKTD